MSAFSVPLSKLADMLNLETIYAPKDLKDIPIETADVHRPGIVLAGYYQYFDARRIQIFGMVEMAYLQELPEGTRRVHLEKLFQLTPPAVLISRSLEPLPEMIDFAQKYEVPVLSSSETTSTLMSTLISILNVELAPRITRHGVFIEVYGEGILILGDSGVGKSETAVELVKRGHRLIADDAVELRRTSNRTIVGTAPENIRHFIELRGVGIVNVAHIFGIGSVKVSDKVDLVVSLEPWDRSKTYSRTGLETDFYDILGVQIPSTVIPVMPGRNLAVIIETAAINNREKKMGYNAARELLARLGLENDIVE
ncbi:MAG: HPr(Ser) kinase/phosphatase [Candidatus Fournierella pullistercoris]|uniref:HPr kinase/phosphorylase n=1 Tax=Candidatus Allofournierella pullistercoris TaxID=2838597 RepID=A0A948T112_9FIRM|nr:HPr(Ser) kinase/phosphatase [Candidatus Fournierella pullistercoris]